ncbi:RsmE family RNA methyltransferase [Anaerosphaera multitolerans]|uniref:Ribosomal RNA small subunit methyltransferase E n=1 Tax=Anaerosphaera multitolerans TaxID=2487351 RepID=A0A437S8Z2_9FIRM|nr:RsmE family RNA methyltransferase [Anaerosphaera multitolerans]RVU55334.1 16S rRNA (uracil(1498)-N(3))-methyltransferase [Anaerosphaera multitolerans]
MYRFFENKVFENEIELSEENSHHFSKVLRIKESEIVEVCADNGIFESAFERIEGNNIILKKIRAVGLKNESKVNLTLFQGILKGDKMDQALKQATEAGVSKIHPLKLKRTISNISGKEEKKVQRWQKVVESAAKQSKRDYIPEVTHPLKLEELKDLSGDMDIIVPYENQLGTTLFDLKSLSNNIALVIGPEGGFEESEINFLREIGANIITLGNRILRAETAAVCSSFSIIYYLESR